jgi:GT2 family glycosyltransferase
MNLDYNLKRAEVIIWDNNSLQESKNKIKDFLYRMVDEKTARTIFIEHHHNLGAFNSRDELFKLVSTDAQYILNLDDDVILPPELLKEALPIFAEDNWVGIIGPRTVYDDAPSETAHGAGFINWWLGHYSTKDARKPLECDYVIGCCMIVKKSVIDEIGGFDHDFYTSHAEVDFCVRAGGKNYKILYYPDISVRHRVDRGGTRSSNRIYYVYRNKLFVIKKNAPLPQKWISMGLYSLFWLPKGIIDSIIHNKRLHSQQIRVIFRAMMDGWLNRGGKRAQTSSGI